jgi:hypothetical protein
MSMLFARHQQQVPLLCVRLMAAKAKAATSDNKKKPLTKEQKERQATRQARMSPSSYYHPTNNMTCDMPCHANNVIRWRSNITMT